MINFLLLSFIPVGCMDTHSSNQSDKHAFVVDAYADLIAFFVLRYSGINNEHCDYCLT